MHAVNSSALVMRFSLFPAYCQFPCTDHAALPIPCMLSIPLHRSCGSPFSLHAFNSPALTMRFSLFPTWCQFPCTGCAALPGPRLFYQWQRVKKLSFSLTPQHIVFVEYTQQFIYSSSSNVNIESAFCFELLIYLKYYLKYWNTWFSSVSLGMIASLELFSLYAIHFHLLSSGSFYF